MSVVGFNSGLSDQLQSIMDARLKAKQQEFENNLKLQDEARKAQEGQQKAEEHAANMETHKQDLADRQAARAEITGEKLSTSLGPGALITSPSQLQTLQTGNQPIAQPTMPITPGIAGVAQMPSASGVTATPGAGAVSGVGDDTTPPPSTTPDALPSGPLGTLQTKVAAPAPTGPINVGTAAMQGVEGMAKAVENSGHPAADTFAQMIRASKGSPAVMDTVGKAMDSWTNGKTSTTKPSFEPSLFNPATKNAVIYDAGGKQGPGLYDTVTHAFVPTPGHYQAPPDPSIAALRNAETTNANSKRQDDSYNRTTAIVEKLATPLDASEQRLGRLSDTLAQGNPQSDALIAPELMVVMAGGMGSGVRINRAEIERVAGGHVAYMALLQTLNKFSLDPAHAQIPQAQRDQIASLVKVVQDKISAKQTAILKMRMTLADPTSSVEDHRKALASLHSTLSDIDTTPAPTSGPSTSKFKTSVGE